MGKAITSGKLEEMPTHSLGIAEIVGNKREDVLRLAAQYGAHSVRVFGSVARGEAGPDSDMDFLVEMETGRSLLDVSGLLIDLQDLLGRRVDVVESEGIHWALRERVLSEARPL